MKCTLLSGITGIIEDPPSLLALICLFCITGVVIHNPAAWPALASFATVMPGVLAFVNHKITLAQMAQNVQTPNLPDKAQL